MTLIGTAKRLPALPGFVERFGRALDHHCVLDGAKWRDPAFLLLWVYSGDGVWSLVLTDAATGGVLFEWLCEVTGSPWPVVSHKVADRFGGWVSGPPLTSTLERMVDHWPHAVALALIEALGGGE